MNDNQEEPETMSTGERMKTLAGAMTDALAHKALGNTRPPLVLPTQSMCPWSKR